MAYSNYGAYVWKNEKDITEETCDKDYIWKDNKWQLNKYENDLSIHKKNEEPIVAFGHAVVPLSEDILIEFYKTFSVKIYIKDKCKTLNFETDIEEKSYFEYEGITLQGFKLDSFGVLNCTRIEYGKDCWCVVVGSSFGKGYDKYHISRFVKKYMTFQEDSSLGNTYWINRFGSRLFVDTTSMVDYMIRKDDRNYIRWSMWTFAIKPLFKSIIRLDLQGIRFNFRELLEKLWELHYSR